MNGDFHQLLDTDAKAIIEIPAGTLDKFELNKKSHEIEHEHKDGTPRVVQYLAYPANYGYIPNTLLAKEDGGDGDPLDVLVLGAAVEREAKLDIKIIGALRLLDRGEQDDKLIAVTRELLLEGEFYEPVERRISWSKFHHRHMAHQL